MKGPKTNFQSIDEYILAAREDDRPLLAELRSTIAKAAPRATEKISYQIPTFYLHGNLVHFAAFKDHIGFYPTSSGVLNFKEELAAYEHSKGAIHFPREKPLPLKLVKEIVRFRVAESEEKAAKKTKAVKKPKKSRRS